MSSPKIEKIIRKRNCGLFLSNSPAFLVQKSSKVLMQSLRATKRAKTFRSCCARHLNTSTWTSCALVQSLTPSDALGLLGSGLQLDASIIR